MSDHASLTVNISIIEEFIPNKQCTIIKNSKKENKFIAELINIIKKIDTEQLNSKDSFKYAIQEFANRLDIIWHKFSKCQNYQTLQSLVEQRLSN